MTLNRQIEVLKKQMSNIETRPRSFSQDVFDEQQYDRFKQVISECVPVKPLLDE